MVNSIEATEEGGLIVNRPFSMNTDVLRDRPGKIRELDSLLRASEPQLSSPRAFCVCFHLL